MTLLRTLTLGQPLALLALLALPLLVAIAHHRLRLTSASLRTGVLSVRLLIAALVVFALAQPTLRPVGHARAVVFAMDVSDSIAPDQLAWARTWVNRAVAALPAGSTSSVIEFGAHAQLAGSLWTLPSDSTDLTAALQLAESLLPRDPTLAPEVVLLTDGWQTSGAPPLEVGALRPGMAVSYVPLPPTATWANQPSAPEARPGEHGAPGESGEPGEVVHTIQVPTIARVGESIDIQLDLQAAQPADTQLRVALDQTVIANSTVHLQAGDTQLSLPAPIGSAGFIQVRADLRELATGATSTLATVVDARPAGRVLVLEDEPGQADALVGLLIRQGLDIERRAPSSLPPSAKELSAFDGAVLVNTPATSLSLDQQRTLQSFVQDMGRGLVVIGGNRSFAPGGYQSTPLDDLMPVSSEPPVAPQQGSLALFLVIDRSGSMDLVTAGDPGQPRATKIAMAREAAIEAAGLLQPQDTLGVVAFDSSYQWIVPPTKVQSTGDIKPIQDEIATIKPGGGTAILPALQAAFEAATTSDAPLKHIVLMTDGESYDRGYEDLLARMAPFQITLSTLAIGSDADTKVLTNLAHLGGGRYYFTERSTQIPRIASKEASILTRNAIVEGQVAATVAEPSPILRSVPGDLPPLSGYVATTRKDRAITALETARGHPLLAHWQYGLGRVVAWTSDAQQGWASQWADWSGAGQFWSQAVRWALPAPVQPDFQPLAQLGPDGRQVSLSVQALNADGSFADLQDTRATVVAPDGSARELALPQRAPGVYGIDTRVSGPGQFRVLFTQGQKQETAAFTAPDAIELHSVGTNTPLLEQLATTSGGHALSDPSELQPGNGPGPMVRLWPWLLLAGLVLLPLDVYLRRRA